MVKKKTCKDCISLEYIKDEETTVCCAGIGVRYSDAEPCIYFEERVDEHHPLK